MSTDRAPHGRATAIPVPALNAAADWIARRQRGLSPDEEAEFEAWRASESYNAAAIARLDPTWTPPAAALPPGAGDEMRPGHAAIARRRRRLAVATVLALLIVVAALLWLRTHSHAVPSPRLP